MEINPMETIVVPRDFAVSVVTLINIEQSNNHPSAAKMIEMTKRKFFIFNREEVIQEVVNNYLRCGARKKISPSLIFSDIKIL